MPTRPVTDAADVLRDPARLAALADTGLPDSPPEEAFDRLTRLAARALNAPTACLSLVDGHRQFFKSVHGAPASLHGVRETPLSHSICARVVESGQALVVPDLAAHPELSTHPMVTEAGLRAYAGYPVTAAGGKALGSFCVFDTRPHEWGAGELSALADLAALAADECERRRCDSELSRTERLLRESGGWFRSVVEQSIMAIYCYQDGHFRYVNPRFAEIFGYSIDEMLRPDALQRVVHPDDFARVAENIRARLDGEIPTVRYTLRGVRADGEVLHLDVHGTRTLVEGRPALIGVGYDITDRVRAEREREGAMAARDRFYAMASHELRTPVSTVMLYNDLLLGDMCGPLSAQQREAVERSQGSARHLLDLINDLLDLSKLAAGRLDVRLEPLDVAALVEEVFAELTPMAAEHGSTLELALASRPLEVAGDRRRIRQILLNLLSNAIKFGGGHPIRVRCMPGQGGVAVEVSDQGSGISPEDLPRIWDDFVQLGEGQPGTGLGLPIARRLAELLGGAIEVMSAPGAGSTFRFVLPGTLPDDMLFAAEPAVSAVSS
ncbi:MAG TPA: ATP-binding protein [Longimicrobium sp.]|nr:ATP-binding protein [Longimicrobium sp.]